MSSFNGKENEAPERALLDIARRQGRRKNAISDAKRIHSLVRNATNLANLFITSHAKGKDPDIKEVFERFALMCDSVTKSLSDVLVESGLTDEVSFHQSPMIKNAIINSSLKVLDNESIVSQDDIETASQIIKFYAKSLEKSDLIAEQEGIHLSNHQLDLALSDMRYQLDIHYALRAAITMHIDSIANDEQRKRVQDLVFGVLGANKQVSYHANILFTKVVEPVSQSMTDAVIEHVEEKNRIKISQKDRTIFLKGILGMTSEMVKNTLKHDMPNIVRDLRTWIRGYPGGHKRLGEMMQGYGVLGQWVKDKTLKTLFDAIPASLETLNHMDVEGKLENGTKDVRSVMARLKEKMKDEKDKPINEDNNNITA